MVSTIYLCYEVTQYSELALVFLLALSTLLLHNTKTVLTVSTHLLNNQLQFLSSLLISSTAVHQKRKCDSLYHFLAGSVLISADQC